MKDKWLVTIEIDTYDGDPREWDWEKLLDPNEDESYLIHSIGQITRNNKEVSK